MKTFIAVIVVIMIISVYSMFPFEDSLYLEKVKVLPARHEGRVKPLDTVARQALLAIHSSQSLFFENQMISPIQWLLEVSMRPDQASGYPIFRIDHPEVLSLFVKYPGERKYFSFRDLAPFLDTIRLHEEMALAVDESVRDSYHNAILKLAEQVALYEQLQGVELFGALDGHERLRKKLWQSYQEGDIWTFSHNLVEYSDLLDEDYPEAAGNARFEAIFNESQPFLVTIIVYLFAFLLVLVFWCFSSQTCQEWAFSFIVAGFLLHTTGLIARMVIEGRPPVTNLYSSAVFVGWGAVLFGLFLERKLRDGLGIAVSAVIGAITLVIAHQLVGSGDTLEVMRAVLNSNFWLAVHVVTITMGYSAMFVAGFVAVFYILRRALTRRESLSEAKVATQVVYGVICFALLFSFVGTVLGGIWADQSWGRFWGWDPKENGALLIILWDAILLHARWAGLLKGRGVMMLAVFGNAVTAFSWFGVNMLGVGLHAYGFTEHSYIWLAVFILSQILIMVLALLPVKQTVARLRKEGL